MTIWDTYPVDYRAHEVDSILGAVQAGSCVSVVGLSGAGKSNLLGFIANRIRGDEKRRYVLVDCNRLAPNASLPASLFRLIRRALGDTQEASDEWQALDATLERIQSQAPGGVCLLFDRYDGISLADQFGQTASNLRSLRDTHKYWLTFVTATRHLLDPHTELSELFYAHTLWLGPLSDSDAHWNVESYAERCAIQWDQAVVDDLIRVSWGYPSLLRAVCEAAADQEASSGAALDVHALSAHLAVQRRVNEFWADGPTLEELRLSGLEGHPLLTIGGCEPVPGAPAGPEFDTAQLTAKEHLLWEFFVAHPNQVCEKDDLIRSVWPEDKIFERGIRDDSLAQLVRRLREKVEPVPSLPCFIHTVPGRGYRYTPK